MVLLNMLWELPHHTPAHTHMRTHTHTHTHGLSRPAQMLTRAPALRRPGGREVKRRLSSAWSIFFCCRLLVSATEQFQAWKARGSLHNLVRRVRRVWRMWRRGDNPSNSCWRVSVMCVLNGCCSRQHREIPAGCDYLSQMPPINTFQKLGSAGMSACLYHYFITSLPHYFITSFLNQLYHSTETCDGGRTAGNVRLFLFLYISI